MSRRLLPVLLLLLAGAAPAAAQTASVLRKGGVNDGDTIIARVAGRTERVRLLGVQAMELTRYNNNRPSEWRGECHAVEAARFVLRTVRRAGHRVRLSRPGGAGIDGRRRLLRRVEARLGGRRRDLGAMLLTRGLGLWLHHVDDAALNRRYNLLQQTAAAKGVGIWDAAGCGPGPAAGAVVELRVMSDPIGEDTADLNSEWVRLTNAGPVPVALGGWYLGNAGPKQERFRFPAGTTLSPGGSLTVHTGAGTNTETRMHRGFGYTLFENSANGGGAGDMAYLVDPDGDVRARTIYPCLVACTDPNQGALDVDANAIRGPEHVSVRNVSGRAVDLFGYQLRVKGAYAFPLGTVLGPGESVQVFVEGSPAQDTPTVKHMGYDGAYMADAGGRATVETYDEIVLGCDAWGSARC